MSDKQKQIVAFVGEKGEAIVDDVAAAVGVTRSTARKHLAGLVDAGELKRTEGGRDRGRKRPDRFSVAESNGAEKGEGSTAKQGEGSAAKQGEGSAAKQGEGSTATGARLGPGVLDGLVLGFMRDHRDDAPHTASRIGKAIERSSGAVANCLRRLADSDQAALVNEKPREYGLPKDA